MKDPMRVQTGMVMTTYSTDGHRRDLAISSIRSLLENTNMSDKFLMIVDDASTDGLRDLLQQEFGNEESIAFIMRVENCGVGANKAVGCETLFRMFPNMRLLYICDDDLIYQSGWFEMSLAMIEYLKETGEEVGMFGLWRHRAHEVVEAIPFELDPRYSLLRVQDLPGCCVFMDPEVYKNAGGWSPGRPEDKRGDDVETTRAIQRLRLNLFACTPPLVLHEGHVYADGKEVCFHDQQNQENNEWIRINDR